MSKFNRTPGLAQKSERQGCENETRTRQESGCRRGITRQEAAKLSLSRRTPPPDAECYEENGVVFYKCQDRVRLLAGNSWNDIRTRLERQ